MPYAQMIAFHEPKAGSTEAEWEDGAGFDPGTGRLARCVVVDGATEAYDAIRWVGLLVEGFLGVDDPAGAPALTDRGMDGWFALLQDRWLAAAPASFANIFEERKFRADGSFATLLGCELDLGPRPRWSAVALGDTVLFHVRGGRLVAQFPPLVEFGLNPDGVFTRPAERDRMRAALAYADGPLAVEDRLYLATDALAEWMVRAGAADPVRLWRLLGGLDHPAQFRHLVTDRRRAGELKNDDVTLLRVEIAAAPPEVLAVCQ